MSDLTLRMAAGGDEAALRRVAERDCSDPLPGRVLLAEAAGAVVAAVSLDARRAIADPFVRTADAVELLQRRADQIRRSERGPRLPLRRSRQLRAGGGERLGVALDV